MAQWTTIYIATLIWHRSTTIQRLWYYIRAIWNTPKLFSDSVIFLVTNGSLLSGTMPLAI